MRSINLLVVMTLLSFVHLSPGRSVNAQVSVGLSEPLQSIPDAPDERIESNLLTDGSDDRDPQFARRSLRGGWYDRSSDSYTAPHFSEAQDHKVRREGWLAGPPRQWPKWKWNWNFGHIANMVVYFVGTGLVIALLALLVWLFMNYMPEYSQRKRLNKSLEIDFARVEDLPFSVQRFEGDLLAQARRLADEGKCEQAIIYLYGYWLLALDQARKVFLQKGKTNGMYLRELMNNRRLESLTESIVLKFEQVHFGRRLLPKESFEQSWNDLSEFHELLHRQPSSESGAADSMSVAEGGV